MRKPFAAMTAKLSSEETAITQKALRARLSHTKAKSMAYSAQTAMPSQLAGGQGRIASSAPKENSSA